MAMNQSVETIKKPRATVGKVVIYVLLTLWAVTTVFPFAWVVNNSFKHSSLVVNDSFSLATGEVLRYDKDGQVVRERIMQDEYGRDMYDKLLFDADGNPVYEGAQQSPTINVGGAFADLLSGMTVPTDEATKHLQAYDTVNGKVIYDESSPPVRLSPTWDNYVSVFTNRNVNILRGYKNSLIISGSVMVVVALFSAMLAFGITRWKFRGAKVIKSLVVAALMFPAFATIVPVYRMLSDMGLYDKLEGVILVQCAGNLAFACTVMMGFINALPYELEEAAFMEGCGPYGIFFRIILPMCKPALATVAIFTFIWSYNDLFLQMVLLRSNALLPVCAILREISSQYGTDFGMMAASVTVVVVPVLIVYALLQKNIIKGLTAGAVKG